MTSIKNRFRGSLLLLAFVLLTPLGTNSAWADNLYWTDVVGDDSWDTAANWSSDPANATDIYADHRVPNIPDYDNARIYEQTSSDLIDVGNANDGPFQMYFQDNGNGYTIDQTPSTSGALNFANWYAGTGIYMESTLVGSGLGETINAPINSAASYNSGPLWITNWSPVAAPTAALAGEGVNGYNNTLTLGGPVTMTSTGTVAVLGVGNVDITGNYTATNTASGNAGFVTDTASGTTTLSGSNSWTGYTQLGGNAVFDYRTNNVQGFSSSAEFNLGNEDANYNGNRSANGGNLTIIGNAAGTTLTMGSVSAGGTFFSGSSSLLVQGSTSTAPSAATNVYLGLIGANYGSATDITTTGNANVCTNSTDDGIYGAQVDILGQYLTYDKSYWATDNEYAYQGTTNGSSTYFQSGTPLLIQGLTTDAGTAFNSQWADFHVANEGASDVQVLSGSNEGADTIRFTSANDPLQPGQTTPDVNSAHTLDLGGGNLNMVYGGIMVTQNVVGNTQITDGTLNGFLDGLSIINYSSGTLTIGANIQGGGFGINGGGNVVLSGNNDVGEYGQYIYINAGTVTLGSNTALGTDNEIDLSSATSVLDLAGYSPTVSKFVTPNSFLPGNAAALAGLNYDIINSKAGSLSTITIEGNQNSGNNGSPNSATGFPNLGWYYGGLNEASGAIISLNIQQGANTGTGNQVQFNLGTADPIGDQSGSNVNNIAGLQGVATEITGAITVGQNAALGLQGYGNIETMGVTTINGVLGATGQQSANYSTTYLTGTGLASGYGGWNFDLNVIGSVADTFTGNFGTASNNAGFNLVTGGAGTTIFTNAIYSSGLTSTDMSQVIAPGLFSNSTLNISGESSVTMTGTGGEELGGSQLLLTSGTLNVAPGGAGADVVVTGANENYYNQLQLSGGSSIVLDKGGNNSLTVELGSNSTSDYGVFNTYTSNYRPSLSIGSAQGLSALGTTDKFVLLDEQGNDYSNPNSPTYGDSYFSESYLTWQPLGIVHPWVVGVNETAGSSQNGTYLSYQGSGTTSDGGFTPYVYAPGNINNLANSTSSNVELVTNAQTLAQDASVYALEVDNGGSINTNGHTLYLGNQGNYANNQSTYEGGIILNGASITGTVSATTYLNVYTDLESDNSIETLSMNGQDLSKSGAGTLYVTTLNSPGRVILDQGVLDLANGTNGAEIVLSGGVLQTNGELNAQLSDSAGGVVFNGNGEYGNNLGGGFSARGGELDVTLNGGATLVWGADVGGTANFVGQNAPLNFGSTTSDSNVLFFNPINLGVAEGGNTGATALYSRVIEVTANSADAGKDPFDSTVTDGTALLGVISSSNSYLGLTKTGDGTLFLYPTDVNGNPANNTYTGATTISEGTLAIASDGALGTAPTAAYALNTSPGTTGAALTPGAVEINGGATLGVFNGSSFGVSLAADVVLNANRQILLASGSTGATPSIINVEGDPVYGYSELDFGGVIADYVNEVGSLEKQGQGTFDYSGTSANTGSLAVTGGTMAITGGGDINSMSGVTVDNSAATGGNAKFNYASTSVGLTKTVTYGSGGGTFAYNSTYAYSGASSLTVGAKDTLSGGGNLTGTAITIANGGTLLPGDVDVPTGTATPGLLSTGAVNLVSGGNYNFLLADATGAAGTGYGSVVASSVNLTGILPLAPFNINLETLAGNVPGAPADFNPSQSYQFTLFSTAPGGITPETQAQLNTEFAVYTEANNGATGFDPAPGTWEVTEAANDSALYLDYTGTAAVPEPSVWAMVGCGLGLLFLARRGRRSSV